MDSNEKIKRIIVITHIPILQEQKVIYYGDAEVAPAYFYNFTIGEEVLKFSKVRDVISGHTHRGILCFSDKIKVQVIPSHYHNPQYIMI